MINFSINFGGFYSSIHEQLLDNAVSQEAEYFEEEYNIKDIDLEYNWSVIFKAYAEEYLENLNEFINDKYEQDIKLHFADLYSPKFYNFSTDTIECDMSEDDYFLIKQLFISDSAFIKFVDKTSKSYDGFASFYEGIDVVKEDNSILMQYTINYILSDMDFIEDLYDLNYFYEFVDNTVRENLTDESQKIVNDLYDKKEAG